jgi:general secretion pathway protein D
VRGGQTAVLGGLIDRQEDRRRSGVPLFKDIPLLGALFGTTERTTTTAELFVFITPHLVATDEDTDRIRSELGDRTRYLRDLLPPDSGRVKREPPR